MGEKYDLSAANCCDWSRYCRAFHSVRAPGAGDAQCTRFRTGSSQPHAFYLGQYFALATLRVWGRCFLFTYGPTQSGTLARAGTAYAEKVIYPNRPAQPWQPGRWQRARPGNCSWAGAGQRAFISAEQPAALSPI